MKLELDTEAQREIEAQCETEVRRKRVSEAELPIAAPEAHVSYWVKRADVRFSKSFVKILRQSQLIASEWAVVRELYGPTNWAPVELGRMMGMSKGGMSKLIARLVKKGYVTKKKNATDHRFRNVRLTKQGRLRVPLIAAMEKSVDREFFAPLEGGGRHRLTQSLQRILTHCRSIHMEEWVSLHSKLDLPTLDDNEPEKPAVDTKLEEFSKYIEEVSRASAYGLPPPPKPAWLVASMSG
jgi:DNA-binding MarR family transcriptional regulator